MKLNTIYERLLKEYGLQGWWPLINYKGVNPTKGGSINGYHPGDYSYPKNEAEKFEIICGALLAQNTSWQKVCYALINLKYKGLLDFEKLVECDIEQIKECIKPAGYFNLKAERLKILAEFFASLSGKTPSREELLCLKGVGPETCDSILLYAYKVPSFVVDSYTKRIFLGLGIIKENSSYDEVKSFVEGNLEKDYRVYGEFHALLVEHAKRFYVGSKNGRVDDLILSEFID